MRTQRRRLSVSDFRYTPLVAGIALVLAPHGAHATSFVVNTGADSATGSLRQAILDANNLCTSADTIDFVGGPFVIAVSTALGNLPNIQCTGLTINGDGSQIYPAATMSGNGLTSLFTYGVTIQNLDISGFAYGSAINGHINAIGNKLHDNDTGFTAGFNSQVTGNVVFANNTGIYVSYGGNTLTHNTVYANVFDGIDVDSVAATIQSNTIGLAPDGTPNGNRVDGLYIHRSASTVDQNVVSASGTGIYLDSDLGSQVTFNKVGTDASGTSTFVSGHQTGNGTGIFVGFASSHTTISDNTISGNGTAIDAPGDSNISIRHNNIGTDITGNNYLEGGDGIDVACATGIEVRDNTIVTSYGGTAIQFSAVQSGGSPSVIATNKIGLAGDGITPLGNNSYGVLLGSGVCASVTANSDSITVDSNTIANQDYFGVLVDGADHSTITGNTITGSGQAGVRIGSLGPALVGNSITGNTIKQGNRGIELSADSTQISGNTITANTDVGIYVLGANHNTMTGNTITGNAGYGIDLEHDADVGNNMAGNIIYGNAGSIAPASAQKNINLDFSGGPRPPNTPGPNSGQNYPVINAVTHDTANGNIVVAFTLDAPVGTYQIEFFGNSPGTIVPGGNLPRGSIDLPVGVAGPTSGTFAIHDLSVDNISLLATHRETSETSEFSPVVSVAPYPGVSVSPASLDFGNVALNTDSTAQSVTLTSNGTTGYRIDAIADGTCYGGSICYGGPFTCTTTCAPGVYNPLQTCDITATFHPLAPGVVSKTIALCDNVTPHSTGPSRTIVITGNGVNAPPPPAAQVDITPTSFDFGQVSQGSVSSPNTFVVSNSGNATASLGTLAATTGFLVNGTSCGATLAASTTCTASVSFAPTSLGAVSGTLSLPWSSGLTALSRKSRGVKVTAGQVASSTLAGTGITPPPVPVAQVDITPSFFDFGQVVLGAVSPPNSFVVRNSGNATANLSAPTASAGFTVASTSCGATLAAGASCSADVSFAPTAVGLATGTLTLSWDSGITAAFAGKRGGAMVATTASASLSGTGVAPVVTVRVAVEPASFDFGPVLLGSASAPQVFAIRNTGNTGASIASVTGSPGFVVTNSSCGGTLAVGAICLANVSFVPTRQGSISGLLTVAANPALTAFGAKQAPGFASTSVALGTSTLSGTGVLQSTVDLPSSIDFGAYTSGAPALRRTVALRASGNAVLTIGSITVTGPFALGNGCPENLQPGDSCSITLDFSASAVGDYSGALIIVTSAAGGSQSIPITAHTVAAPVAQIRVSPLSIGFGDRLLGSASPTQRVTISNVGNADATMSPPATTSADFLVATTTCGATLAPASSCFADVLMRPAGFGPRAGRLIVNSSAADSPAGVDLSGTGCRPFSMSASRLGSRFGCAP